MFENFLGSFAVLPTDQKPGAVWREERLSTVVGYLDFATRFAGISFENGLYRFHDAASGPLAQTLVVAAFPNFAGQVSVFGQDWLGRQFGIDWNRRDRGEPLILMLEPGTGEVLDIPAGFVAFHDDVLINQADAALAVNFFERWAVSPQGQLPLRPEMCVGYQVPLFLGGSDEVENLEETDLDVYWTLTGQLLNGIRGQSEGTQIHDVDASG